MNELAWLYCIIGVQSVALVVIGVWILFLRREVEEERDPEPPSEHVHVAQRLIHCCSVGVYGSENVSPFEVASLARNYGWLRNELALKKARIKKLSELLDTPDEEFDQAAVDLRQFRRGSSVTNQINGAVLSAVEIHGPITRDKVGSVTKRVIGALKTHNRYVLEKKS